MADIYLRMVKLEVGKDDADGERFEGKYDNLNNKWNVGYCWDTLP